MPSKAVQPEDNCVSTRFLPGTDIRDPGIDRLLSPNWFVLDSACKILPKAPCLTEMVLLIFPCSLLEEERREAMKKPKIFGIQFKYLGDTVVATPVLRAIKTHFAGGELHVLIPEAAVPLLEHIEWIDKVWSIPRKRDHPSLVRTWPIIRQLRKGRFDVTIDFAGNDRGAILSRIIGGRRRIGPIAPKGFFLRKRCYTEPVEEMDTNRHETVRTWAIASVLGVPFPEDPTVEIGVNRALIDKARPLLDGVDLVCCISATQPKREWPLENWVRFMKWPENTGSKWPF